MPSLRSLLAIFLLLLASPVFPATDNRPLVIAQATDLSGPGADFGRDHSLGAKVYFDHINSSGGVNGRRIVYRSRDTGGVPAQGLAAAHAFIKDGANVLFGFSGDNTVEAVARDATVRAAGLPVFAPVTGNTGLGIGDGVYYLRTGVAQEIQTLVAHLASLGIRSFGIATADEHGRDAVAALQAEAVRHGARVVAQTSLATAGDGPSRAAQAIAREHPQAVIVVGDTLAVAQFFQRYRSLDPGAFLCAPSLVNVRTLTSAIGPQAARGVIVSQVVPDPATVSELTREHRKIMEKYADEPISQATLEGFIAAKALVLALRRSADGSAGLAQAIRSNGRFDLSGYELNFAQGQRASTFVELTVVNRDGRLSR